MTIIGVITRGKYGNRLIDTLHQHSDFSVKTASLPARLPDFLDEPEEFVKKLDINPDVFNADTIITYSLHPDITPVIARLAGQAGVSSLIVPGGSSRAPLVELDRISSEYGIYIEVDEVCCTLAEKEETAPYSSVFGLPEFEVSTKSGYISDVRVRKGAPCGSTWKMAEKLIGTKVEDAPAKAGLLIQQYPCRAVRGQLGGIHDSAELHKKAMERALITLSEK
ncbi:MULTISPECIES: DUF166 domain-containing protein [Methanohalophilus]|jgi:hypothetical protein|uniref:Thymidylate synthase n=1 Tax=Methanohalophilus euhalobius TaxID=51203 RepID=A0A285GCB6_9EURY|nr:MULTISPECIES: DUF166 domain-containing protein [Methanohalophilus]RSD34832.1 MAG: hypothetical protein CI953_561 [Methanohalophilus sp.]ODV50225.1 MAG: hypothetical protein A8273_531 [Methanohalophilus sp. 2-GBenrich]PQV41999.1 hypothetical protein B0H22_11110 [Methanohalophilus euhalobius]RNI12137.1 hypothetical protein EDD83_02265 [Methanohalophilus euhalobius]RSD36407.1 MAG: hypothetical protein CI952_174 [Methanohalophilus sp.]